MTNPPLTILIKHDDKILEVVLNEKEKAGIYAFLTNDKKLKVIDRDLKGKVLEDICG